MPVIDGYADNKTKNEIRIMVLAFKTFIPRSASIDTFCV